MQIPHTTPLWEITCYMGSHNVTCHPAAVTFPQPKLVLDLATQEGCKAELTWVVVTSQDSLPAKGGLVVYWFGRWTCVLCVAVSSPGHDTAWLFLR